MQGQLNQALDELRSMWSEIDEGKVITTERIYNAIRRIDKRGQTQLEKKMDNPHSGKNISDPDVDPILIHADEVMTMISYLKAILGDEWDYPSCSYQEIFDLYLWHHCHYGGR